MSAQLKECELKELREVSLLDGRVLSEVLGSKRVDICVMCGIMLDSLVDRRSHTVSTFVCNLEHNWLRTTYSWSCISALCCSSNPNDRLSTCGGCTNWLRRCDRFIGYSKPSPAKRSNKKKFLPMDELIGFSLAPGEVHMPDLRNITRLYYGLMHAIEVLGESHSPVLVFRNFYLSMLPCHLRECFESLGALQSQDIDNRFILKSIVHHWWRINNHTEIFRSLQTSSLLRRVTENRDEELCNDMETDNSD